MEVLVGNVSVMATDEQLEKIANGYKFDGDVVRLGAAMSEGEPHPEVPVSLPMSMMNRHGLVAGATGLSLIHI